MKIPIFKFLLTVLYFFFFLPNHSSSYGLLSHESIIDKSWKNSIVPLLKFKFPNVTDAELQTARAFVYGGSLIPDMGYYPFGSEFFSDLVHYVRSGDFIRNLLGESHTLNEYAFSLGVLSHFEADTYGHSDGTNLVVPVLFPKLRNKDGNVVTYEEGKNQHARVEFGFDVLQTARGNYSTNSYHDFIGFQISDSLFGRAFLKTYGIELKSIFKSLPLAVSTFRFAVKIIIPELTRDAWKVKNSFIVKLNPLSTEKLYHYSIAGKAYRKEFDQPRFQSTLVEFVMVILPKVGPLSKFKPKMPDKESEKLFEQSFDSILFNYSKDLARLKYNSSNEENINLDTGKKSVLDNYKLCDAAYYKLLMKLSRHHFENADQDLKRNLMAYYKNLEKSKCYGPGTAKGKKIKQAIILFENIVKK